MAAARRAGAGRPDGRRDVGSAPALFAGRAAAGSLLGRGSLGGLLGGRALGGLPGGLLRHLLRLPALAGALSGGLLRSLGGAARGAIPLFGRGWSSPEWFRRLDRGEAERQRRRGRERFARERCVVHPATTRPARFEIV